MLVLYAEDDIEDFEIFCDIIKNFDPTIDCINARDGSEAMKILEDSVPLPDLIFLDINMPTKDGKSCLKHIKRDTRLQAIPVIIYTTSSLKNDIELCRLLGATDYIIKPNNIGEATQQLAKFFKIKS